MQIVIDISEDDYRKVQDGRASVSMMRKAIRNGTPLPKGHGRLIDEKVAYRKFYARCLAEVATEVFAETPIIIEADKEESEG